MFDCNDEIDEICNMLPFKTLTFDEAEYNYEAILERDTGLSSRTDNRCECLANEDEMCDRMEKDDYSSEDIESFDRQNGLPQSIAVLDALNTLVLILDGGSGTQASSQESNTKRCPFGDCHIFNENRRTHKLDENASEKGYKSLEMLANETEAKFSRSGSCMDKLSMAIVDAIGYYPDEFETEVDVPEKNLEGSFAFTLSRG